MVTVLGILAGAALGSRYRVVCLVPVIVIGIVAVTILDCVKRVPLSSTALTAVVLAVGLQIGYIVGAAVRLALASAPSRPIIAPEPRHDQPARIF